MRYPIRMDPPWRPLLAALGARASNSYVDVTADTVEVRFGPWFDEKIPRSAVVSVSQTGWPLLAGTGWRVTLDRGVGLIGSRQGVVRMSLAEPRRMRLGLLPWLWRFDRVSVSLEDPAAFVAELAAVTVP